ncbi:MAG: hypothetical protein KDK39_05825 [Leptospiraceae bacterium]|nr:hypothetical protein [Leptospiraceae bacterium]
MVNSDLDTLFDIVAGIGHVILFVREGDEFRLQRRAGYDNRVFSYPFLGEDPDVLGSVFSKGFGCLPVRGYSSGFRVWGLCDSVVDPEYLLLVELPEAYSEAHIKKLRSLLVPPGTTLPGRWQADHSFPGWFLDQMEGMTAANAPLLIEAAPGSGVQAFVCHLAEQLWGPGSWCAFAPGRLSEKVQLHELYGDQPGVRLSGGGRPETVVSMASPVALILEPGNLAPQAQLRILSSLSLKQDEPRWLFGSSMDLDALVMQGRLDAALLKLLRQKSLRLPSVMEKRDQLGVQADRILQELLPLYRREFSLSPAARQHLGSIDWPGDWSQFRQTIRVAALTSSSEQIGPGDLRPQNQDLMPYAGSLDLRSHTRRLEQDLILEAYALHGGNQVHMAESLGLSRGSLQNKMLKYRLGEGLDDR